MESLKLLAIVLAIQARRKVARNQIGDQRGWRALLSQTRPRRLNGGGATLRECSFPHPASKLGLTGKHLLTHNGRMVATTENESDVFGAIRHPARRQMLDLLAGADHSVNAIAGHFRMSRPAVSQHLRILLDAGLVTEQRHGRERRYHFVPEQLGPVWDWIAQYERFWDDRLQRLQNQLSKGSKE